MQRDEKGRFVRQNKGGVTIQFPPFLSMVKYLFIAIIFYPWYTALFKNGKVEKIMEKIVYFDPSASKCNLSESQVGFATPGSSGSRRSNSGHNPDFK